MLSGLGISREINEGRIIIDPFDEKCLNPNSYDLHLAPELLIYDCYILRVGLTNPTEKIVLDDYRDFTLSPGVLYLASTIEWTETHYPWVPQINGKSSLGRLGIRTHCTAGFGDVGFKGRWTLEIDVVHPVVVKAGMRICQICYSRIEGEIGEGGLYQGRYQDQQGAVAYKPAEE